MRGRESLVGTGLVVLGLMSSSSARADEAFLAEVTRSEPGRSYESVRAVSADGSTVVGRHMTYPYSDPGMASSEAFSWTLSDGMKGLGDLNPNLPLTYSCAEAASSDGSVIVGSSPIGTDRTRAFRWTEASGMVELGSLPSFPSVMAADAFGVSGDGSVVVGTAINASGDSLAFRWTEAEGMISLGTLGGQAPFSQATQVSLDGTTIVGCTTSWDLADGFEAFIWTEETGMVGLLSSECSQGCLRRTCATAVSANGSVVAGIGLRQVAGADREQAFRWTSETGLQVLPDSPDGFYPRSAEAMSADGSIIVGGTSSLDSPGYVWDEVHGTRSLTDFLQNEWHLNIEGWSDLQPTGISADGLTMVGVGGNGNWRQTGWVAHVPESSVPPGIVRAVSRRNHRDRGSFDIDLLHPTADCTLPVECRIGGPTWVVVRFERPVQIPNILNPNNVTVTTGDGRRGTVTDLAVDYSELTIGMEDVPDRSIVTIAFPGIKNLAGVPISAVLTVGVLAGDTNGDGGINVIDLISVRNVLNQPVDATTFTKDVVVDGRLNVLDLVTVRNSLNKTITCPPPPGVLSIVELDDFSSTGFQGGPFTPASKTYTLINTGESPITWTAGIAQTWLTLSKTSGSLAAGASDTVEVSVNAEASSLAVGSFRDTITITNTTNGTGSTTRAVNLTMKATPPGMAFIPAGEFQMGDPFDEGDSNEVPRHTVYVDAFFMDRYEVTNQQYVTALNWAVSQGTQITVSGGRVFEYRDGKYYLLCSTTAFSSYSEIAWNGSTFSVTSGKGNRPVSAVTWYASTAYANWQSAVQGLPFCYDLSTGECNWAGGYRLPTEAEWEKAARGGAEGHRFPWSDSDDIQHTRANYLSLDNHPYDTSATRGYHPQFGAHTGPVGYFAPNGYGLYDMAGNLFEWCNDWYDSSYYLSSPYNDPRGAPSGVYRVVRGGSWDYTAYGSRCAMRTIGTPTTSYLDLGFRLVMAPR